MSVERVVTGLTMDALSSGPTDAVKQDFADSWHNITLTIAESGNEIHAM